MEGVPKGSRRRWLVMGGVSLIGATILGLGLAYLFLVVRDQPLTRGSTSSTFPAKYVDSPIRDGSYYLVDYVDGETVTVEASVRNQGRFAVTVNDVQRDPPYWAGLATLTAARAAVMHGPAPCCDIDLGATWAAPAFRPMHLDPGQEGIIVLHLRVGHCHHNSPGGSADIEDVTVDYDELGYHGTMRVPLAAPVVVRYDSTDVCP